MRTWRDRLKARMDELEMSAAELTRAAGVSYTMMHQILKRGVTPSVDNLTKIAHALGMSLAELLEGREPPSGEFPITANLSADGSSAPTHAPNDLVKLKIEGGEVVAIRILGHHLAPFYRDGDVLLGPRRAGARADNMIGLECIVCTSDDQIHVRYLARGSVAGRFHLRGHAATTPDIEDAKVTWVAPVAWVHKNIG